MSAIKSLGTKLYKLKKGSEPQDLLIGNLDSVGEIKIESDEIDVTTLDNDTGYKTYIAGFKDAGSVDITGFVETTGEAFGKLLTLVESQDLENWEIVPNGVTKGNGWKFSGFIKSFGESESSVDGVRKFSASIRISGKPTFGV